jgi:small subunit ribosomal protein S15
MARMYSRRKGKSGSTRPSKKAIQVWSRYKGKEIELLISKIAKEEKSPSKIGMILRDSYGVPDVKTYTGKKIAEILDEKKLKPELPEDLFSLIKKSVTIRKHLDVNPLDETAKRGLILTESKIKRLLKYYKSTGKVDLKWKYDPSKARLSIE